MEAVNYGNRRIGRLDKKRCVVCVGAKARHRWTYLYRDPLGSNLVWFLVVAYVPSVTLNVISAWTIIPEGI